MMAGTFTGHRRYSTPRTSAFAGPAQSHIHPPRPVPPDRALAPAPGPAAARPISGESHRRLDALIRAHADPAARRARLMLNLEFAAVPGANSPMMAGHGREDFEALNAAASPAYASLRRRAAPPAGTS
jgi:hypothetical protein